MSIRPIPCAPARSFSSVMISSGLSLRPSIATGLPSVKLITTSSGSRGRPGSLL